MARRLHVDCLRPSPVGRQRSASGFTLIEMLIAMAITLVMIGAVVTLFANLSNSVRNRRAVVEMSGQLRHVRNMLQQDLAGATCPGLTWQRPDENRGYIEIIEGPSREGHASILVDAKPNDSPPQNWPPTATNPEIDHTTSILPTSNVPLAESTWETDGGSLGDHDDILMLTVRNEHEPFIGRVPKTEVPSTDAVRQNTTIARPFAAWGSSTIESPLAEVVWYAVENPGFEDTDYEDLHDGFFGEPGMRTIYRRALLIAPWINPYRFVNPTTGAVVDTFRIGNTGPTFTAQPGLVRILPDYLARDEVDEALACLIAFQERYDLSVRLEFDPLLDSPNGRWKIVANTLGDLTKRENRYEHHFLRSDGDREFPYAVASIGNDYQGGNVRVVTDPEIQGANAFIAATANLDDDGDFSDVVATYTIDPDNFEEPDRRLPVRPFAFVQETSATLATARAMLNDDGEVVHVVHGLVPLTGKRRGEDVMLTDALGFDLRVYDPGAPLYGVRDDPSDSSSPLALVLEPTDPAWKGAYQADMPNDTSYVGDATDFPFVGQGAFVDLGYGFPLDLPRFAAGVKAIYPWFFQARALSDAFHDARAPNFQYLSQLAPGYAVYDTWSFHYENDGIDQDNRDGDNNPITGADEGTNGIDDRDPRLAGSRVDRVDHVNDVPVSGPDDVGERETAPPYDKPLRGVQVVLRLYERDSRQVRQVSVNQSFVPE